MKLSRKKIMATVAATATAIMCSVTAYASPNYTYSFTLYPGESSITGECTKTDTKGAAIVTTRGMYGVSDGTL